MERKEINPIGNFDSWEPSKLKELKRLEISKSLGQKLLFENKNIKVWETVLFPKQRLPFREINRNYNFVSMTDGVAITRYANGKISLLRFKEGDSEFMRCEGNELICDLENIGENILFLHMMEFKPLVEKTSSSNISSLL